jgi:hypothetical protein
MKDRLKDLALDLVLIGICVAIIASMTGCATTAEPEVIVKTRTIDTGCQWTKPIYVDRKAVLTDDMAKDILAHNEAGKERCGWKPVKKN